jgi:hypothetical protein
VCKGNVGKPPGKFIWKKLRHGEQSPIIYSDVRTTSTKIAGNCTFYGTSNLTIQLTDLDNKAKIQCVEESKLSSENLTSCAWRVPHSFHVNDDAMHFKREADWLA